MTKPDGYIIAGCIIPELLPGLIGLGMSFTKIRFLAAGAMLVVAAHFFSSRAYALAVPASREVLARLSESLKSPLGEYFFSRPTGSRAADRILGRATSGTVDI